MAIPLEKRRNVFFRDGSGNANLAKIGNIATPISPVLFTITPPDGFAFWINSINLVFLASGGMRADRFGTRAPLTNGLLFFVTKLGHRLDFLGGEPIRVNGDFANFGTVVSFGNNRGMQFRFGEDILHQLPNQQLAIAVQDRLNNKGLLSLKVMIQCTILGKGEMLP